MHLGSEEQGGEPELTTASLAREFASFVASPSFPCLGAKAALNASSYVVSAYDKLGAAGCTNRLAKDLESFTQSETVRGTEYATFVAAFRQPRALSEEEFEKLLWLQLQLLHDIDATRFGWDSAVSPDPSDRRFSFSFGSRALYVVGMHPHSSRMARRFPWPALVFNPHQQFEKLRADGKWRRMQEVIRSRDIALQGAINPMLTDFGEGSEARQYSGRAVKDGWKAPFQPEGLDAVKQAEPRCPFDHVRPI